MAGKLTTALTTTATIDEKNLLLRLRDGDEMAFHQLYERYKSPIAAKLLALLKDDGLAQDALQDVFLSVWLTRDKLDPELSFGAYLHKIARNRVIDVLRKAQADQRLFQQLLREADEASSPVEATLILNEEKEKLYRALAQLPERQREVFLLHKIEGKSYQEISEQLQIGHAAINQHIYRAMKTLTKLLNTSSASVSVFISVLFGQ